MLIFGFTLLRNGLKYDYPYRESLRTLTDLSEWVFLALGESQDGTEESLEEFRKLTCIPTVWDENLRKSGLILSQQTNVALEALRNRVRDEGRLKAAWGIYLQADEVFCDQECEQIRQDLQRAEETGCDAVSFRYLHFWQTYDQIAVGKRWYPQEVRAIRLDSSIESYGDAQGFRPLRKIYESDAHVFHYGHVREKQAYELKKNDFHRWWHSDEELAQVIDQGQKKDRLEPTLRYLGPHPKVMWQRMGEPPQPPIAEEVRVVGDVNQLSHRFIESIRAKKVHWIKEGWFERLCSKLGLGRFQMASPQARAFTPEFKTLLRLSERGVWVDRLF